MPAAPTMARKARRREEAGRTQHSGGSAPALYMWQAGGTLSLPQPRALQRAGRRWVRWCGAPAAAMDRRMRVVRLLLAAMLVLARCSVARTAVCCLLPAWHALHSPEQA